MKSVVAATRRVAAVIIRSAESTMPDDRDHGRDEHDRKQFRKSIGLIIINYKRYHSRNRLCSMIILCLYGVRIEFITADYIYGALWSRSRYIIGILKYNNNIVMLQQLDAFLWMISSPFIGITASRCKPD